MIFKKKKNIFLRSLTKNLAGFVFYENALLFSKILKQAKNYTLFEKKIRYTKARIVAKNFVGFEKRNYDFQTYLYNKKKKNTSKISVIHSLLLLSLKVKNLGNKLLKNFATKFVGKEAQLLVNNFLNTYISMYKFWYENEKWGFFDEDLTEKTKLKLMKYFWLNKPRRFLRSKLWVRAYQHNRFGFKYIKKFGYNLRSLKITDQLFFWHAFTRKKLKQTLWISRTCQIFRKILSLKKAKKKLIIKSVVNNTAIFNVANFFFYKNFVKKNIVICKFLNLNFFEQFQKFFVTSQKLNKNFYVFVNTSWKVALFFLFFCCVYKSKKIVFKKFMALFYIVFLLKFFKNNIIKKQYNNLYNKETVFRFFYTKITVGNVC